MSATFKGLKEDTPKLLRGFFLCFSLACTVAGIIIGKGAAFAGLFAANTVTTKLTTDVLATGGLGGGLLNVGIVGLMSWALIKFSKSAVGGASFGAFFLMVGFAFFGKTVINIIPVILGTYLYSRYKKESFASFVNMSLFACALAPAVSELAFGADTLPIPVKLISAVVVGLLIGFIFPAVASHTAGMHKGFNLFNAGLAAGLIGIIISCAYKTLILAPEGVEYALNSVLSDGYKGFFNIFLGVIFAAALIVGLVLDGGFAGWLNLVKRTGHQCDFTKLDGGASVLVNFGILGAFGLVYLNVIGAPFTGPTIGALLCMLCWAGNGSHVVNVLPIFIGYALVAFAAKWTLATQGIAVGIMFASGLSPIAGKYKIGWGVIAGALHACLVSYTAAFHGGLNGYNGGFTSGLVAMVLIVIIEALSKKKEA